MSIDTKSLELHQELTGKINVGLKSKLDSYDDLSLLYSPGVAAPCVEISKNKTKVYEYTWKQNTVAVISDGSAVLGLGNIGAEASLPVMEGKAALFKRFADVNAVPIVLDTQDTQEIINIVKAISPGFGGINLEDIASPRCVEIERELQKSLNIPIFHDDQHGTAIVVLAGLINALKLVNKEADSIKVVISGTGAAGSAIIKLLYEYGISNIVAFNSKGKINAETISQDPVVNELKKYINMKDESSTLSEALVGSDVFIGVSVANILTEAMVSSMNSGSIIFALANPNPEINYCLAKNAGAKIVATGRSDFPNQINNVLVFPGLFKGLLEVRATNVPNEVKINVAKKIASLLNNCDLSEESIIPQIFDERVVESVSSEVVETVLFLRDKGVSV